MRAEGGTMGLCIYLQSTDRYQGRSLYQAVVEKAKKLGIARVSVTQGFIGYGTSDNLHFNRRWCLLNEVPVLIEAIDKETRLRKLLSCLDDMIQDGIVTVQVTEGSYIQKKFHSELSTCKSFYETIRNLFDYFKLRIYVVYIPRSS